MTILILGSLAGALLGWLMGFLSLFLIMLILIQRGKGGGLTGALGGPGGQSAFGSKAGDTFTVITIVVASIWGFTCAFTMWLLGTHTPTSVTETNMSAGPGDDEGMGTEPIIPPAAGSGIGDFGGIGGLTSGDDAAAPPETPSMELTPVDRQPQPKPDASDPASTPSEDSPAAETPEDKTPAADSPEAETPSADSPEAETPEAETPEAETPEAETPEAETPEAETPSADAGAGDPAVPNAGGNE